MTRWAQRVGREHARLRDAWFSLCVLVLLLIVLLTYVCIASFSLCFIISLCLCLYIVYVMLSSCLFTAVMHAFEMFSSSWVTEACGGAPRHLSSHV